MPHSPEPHLSELPTLWTILQQAHDGSEEEMARARAQMMERYGRPIYRYLFGALRDSEVASDLAQDFAQRFLQGDFRSADPRCGRFRNYVKTVLFHMVATYQRRQRKALPLPVELEAPAGAESAIDEVEADFLRAWREHLLNRAWASLQAHQERTGRPVYDVLRFASEHPTMRSAEMASEMGARLGRSLKADAVRQALHRSRELFARLLVDEVCQTLDRPNLDRLTDELISLDLLRHCRTALKDFGSY